jgi:hypothetical protein
MDFSMRRSTVLVLCLSLLSTAPSGAASDAVAPRGELPAFDAKDPKAPAVTAKNLLASERFWPYYVSLVEAWQPPGEKPKLPKGARGVLTRVESSGSPLIDFGRDGQYAVPLARTDLVAQANRVRRGELAKMAPNFTLAIGPHLIDSAPEKPRAFGFDRSFPYRGFLAVFADPRAEGFAELAKSLAPLRERAGVLTILFPQGPVYDATVAERLRALAWPVPFVLDHISEAYTGKLLPGKAALPAVQLQSSEGRLIYESSWKPATAGELRAALDNAFPEPAAAAAE